jgi:hypothetical protein
MRKPFKNQNAAVTAAFFVAPIIPSVFIPLAGGWRFPPDLVGASLVYLVALPVIVLLGLPLFLLFSRIRIFSWWGALLGGASAGAAILAVVGGRYNFHGVPLLVFSAAGAATGLTFWTVVMLGPEPSQAAARNWVGRYRRHRK